MRRRSKFECFTIQGNGLLEVSHGFGTAITISEREREIDEVFWAIWMSRRLKFECFTIQGNGLLEVRNGFGMLIAILEGGGEAFKRS
jgi:hypothetical protein